MVDPSDPLTTGVTDPGLCFNLNKRSLAAKIILK